MKKIIFLLLLFPLIKLSAQQDIVDKFIYGNYVNVNDTMVYRLFIPEGYDSTISYPLVLTLHGAGERGDDNEMQITEHRLATTWADSVNQAGHPCFVLSPQCPEEDYWSSSPAYENMVGLLDSIMYKYLIDSNRVYVTGLSMGGYGTWRLLDEFPARFAAAVPMSGGTSVDIRGEKLKHTPVWNFHGQTDNTVSITNSRDLINAIDDRGHRKIFTHNDYRKEINLTDEQIAEYIESHVNVLSTEYPGQGHVIWAESYDLPLLHEWMFGKYLIDTTSVFITDKEGYLEISGIDTIKWESDHVADSVEIWYSPDDSKSWIKICDSVSNTGTYIWNTEDFDDCSYGIIKLYLKDSVNNIYGYDYSAFFNINNGTNGMPYIKLEDDPFKKSNSISLDEAILHLMLGDPDNDETTVDIKISYDLGESFESYDQFTVQTTADTVDYTIDLTGIIYQRLILKVEINDGELTYSDETPPFYNTHGFIPENLTELPSDVGRLHFYPNPVSGELNVEAFLNVETKMTINLCDIQGRKTKTLFKGKLQSGQNKMLFDTTDMDEGMYILSFRMKDEVVSKELFIK